MKQIAEYKVTTGRLCPSLLEWSYDELTLGLIQTCIPNREKMPIYYPLVNKWNAEIVNHTTQIKRSFLYRLSATRDNCISVLSRYTTLLQSTTATSRSDRISKIFPALCLRIKQLLAALPAVPLMTAVKHEKWMIRCFKCTDHINTIWHSFGTAKSQIITISLSTQDKLLITQPKCHCSWNTWVNTA